MSTPVASVVIVSFASEDTLAAAIQSIPAAMEVVVVEQHAGGHASELARSIRADAVTVRSGANRGFGAGCNLGAANARGEVLIFLNPDAAFEPGAAEQLTARAVAGAIVGPSVLDGDGTTDTRARNASGPVRNAVHMLVPPALIPRSVAQDIPPRDPRYAQGGEVPYAQGCCLAVRRDAFFSVGGFDEAFFLYGEEEHLSAELARQGTPTVLVPSAVVRHVGQTSTDAVGSFATEQYYRSLLITYRRQGGAPRALAGATALTVAVVLLTLTLPVRRIVGYRPAETLAWSRAAMRGIAAGFRQRPVRAPDLTAPDAWTDTVDPAGAPTRPQRSAP